jgi:hypothetical protein
MKQDRLKVARLLDTKINHGKPTSTKVDFKPPAGSWEEHVQQIDACEGKDGTVSVYLTWKGGQKTRHTLNQVYNRCPQRVRYNTKHIADECTNLFRCYNSMREICWSTPYILYEKAY